MKKAVFLALVFLTSAILPALAQQKESPAEDVKHSQDILKNLDTLMTLWYVKNAAPIRNKHSVNIRGYKLDDVPSFSDSVYASRIRKIESPLPLTYNATVKAFIDLYAVRKRDQVERMLGISQYYFPIFEEILDKHGMPLELKYLSVVESALNTRALSKVGASGLWQFMYGTGVLYNLEINSYIDCRKDPYKATEAAAIYLKDLHNVFGDWFLAIAAYNCGPGNVNKAIRRSGGKRTFWEIYNYLPVETRGYVPAFIAATYVFTYHQEHNLYPMEVALPTMVDTVVINKEIALDPIAKVLNLPVDELRDLNPQYKRDVIPARGKNYFLRLPATKAYAFGTYKDSIYNLYDQQLAQGHPSFTPNDTDGITEIGGSHGRNSHRHHESGQWAKVRYTVKAGDNLAMIADLFDVSTYSLKHWNNLRHNKVNMGQRLTINVPADKLYSYKRINTMTAYQKKKLLRSGHIQEQEEEEAPKVAVNSKKEKADKKKGKEKIVYVDDEPDDDAPAPDKDKAKTKDKSAATAKAETPKTPKVRDVQETEPDKTITAPSRVSYYVIQKGDTLWSIAQRFPGVTVEDIMKVNGIKDNHSIQVGQKIKITKA
jgi:membrane-bound lytic murein transglycosylase D